MLNRCSPCVFCPCFPPVSCCSYLRCVENFFCENLAGSILAGGWLTMGPEWYTRMILPSCPFPPISGYCVHKRWALLLFFALSQIYHKTIKSGIACIVWKKKSEISRKGALRGQTQEKHCSISLTAMQLEGYAIKERAECPVKTCDCAKAS